MCAGRGLFCGLLRLKIKNCRRSITGRARRRAPAVFISRRAAPISCYDMERQKRKRRSDRLFRFRKAAVRQRAALPAVYGGLLLPPHGREYQRRKDIDKRLDACYTNKAVLKTAGAERRKGVSRLPRNVQKCFVFLASFSREKEAFLHYSAFETEYFNVETR